MSLKRTPRFHIAPRGGQNGARPGYGAILHGECALGVLKDLFGFPGRSGHIGGRAPAQGVHQCAVEALGVPNANLLVGWSLSTTPSPKPHVPQSVDVRAGYPRTVWVSLTSGQGILNLYQGGLERDYHRMVAAYHPSPKPYGPRSTSARAERPG